MESDLCNRCGSCVGLSGGAVAFADRAGRYRPEIVGPVSPAAADRLWSACAGKLFGFPEHRDRLFRDAPRSHVFLGAYRRLYIGHATDPEVRRTSASGGVLSSVLLHLLRTGRIDGAVVLGMSQTEPWLTQPMIARTPDAILAAAQSKYVISSVNEIFPEIEAFDGALAYVGLPGQVQSIRKLQAAGDPAVRAIRTIVGPFYGNTLHVSSVRSFLRAHGLNDLTDITKLYFRYGEWPGKMRIETRSGRVVEMDKFHANFLIPFHILKNSLLCTDLTNEFCDISAGDAWAPVYEERGKGYSMVIARSEGGEALLQEMVADNVLVLDPISEDDAIAMHSHGYDLKKRGTFIRIRFRRMLGRDVPDYGYALTGFPVRRYAMELVIDVLFWLCSTRPARVLLETVPVAWTGRVFERARVLWKKATHDVKRADLAK